MMKVCVLGSGSRGNATLLQTERTLILIDAGFSATNLRKKMAEVGVHYEDVKAIILTHDHNDHCAGVHNFVKKTPVRVYATHHTGMELRYRMDQVPWTYMEKEQSFSIDDMVITPFAVPHDAVDPVGLRIETERSSLGYVTDCGVVTPTVLKYVQHVQTLFVESNYDPQLLDETPNRPYHLKMRIHSASGHLSNEMAGELVSGMAHKEMKNIILGHLSRESNTEELARKSMLAVLERLQMPEVSLYCANQNEPSPWISVGG